MFCTQCGSENREDAHFCHKCGQSVVPLPSQIESITNVPDEKSRALKKVVPWLIWPIAGIALLLVYMLILGFGKMAGKFGKQASQSTQSSAASANSHLIPLDLSKESTPNPVVGGNEYLFDVAGARKAGYSDSEIVTYLATQSKYDLAGARKAGHSDTEIIAHLIAKKAAIPSP